jgi:exopolysaccharide production protein ExoZ
MSVSVRAPQSSLESGSSALLIASMAPLLSVQILRAIAALLVLFSHAEPSLAEFGYGGLIPDFNLGACGVDLFFVISGFIMVYTSERLFAQRNAPYRFFSRRLIRIVPLYWALTTLVVLGWHGFKLPSHLTLTNVITSYLFVPTPRPGGRAFPVLVVGWTLNYEMFFYALFAVTIVFHRRMAVIVLSALLFAIVTIPSLLGLELTAPWSVWTSPLVYEFVFGMWIGLAFREGWRIPPVISCVLVTAALFLMIYCYMAGITADEPLAGHYYSRPLTWGVGAAMIVGAVALSSVERPVPYLLKPMVVIGDASYALYLFHSFVPFILMVVGVPRFINPMLYPYSYSALFVVLSIASSLVVHSIDERVRRLLLGNRRFKPAPAASI